MTDRYIVQRFGPDQYVIYDTVREEQLAGLFRHDQVNDALTELNSQEARKGKFRGQA